MKFDVEQKFNEQLSQSELMRNAFSNIEKCIVREIDFDGFSYTLQLNPARIKSSTANIHKPLAQSNCFLCKPNMPVDQMKNDYDGEFFICFNPYPILRRHLTIVSHSHRPQSIIGNTMRMLRLSADLDGMTVFYNSPKSGASAPFHCHFQAGFSKELPAFRDIETIKDKYTLESGNGIHLIKEPTRGIVVIEGEDINDVDLRFRNVLNEISLIYDNPEPEANIGVACENGRYRIIIFPREKHRPDEYYNEGSGKILVSPGFADMAGLIPCSRPEDYDKITKENITSIMNQVSIPADKLVRIRI